MRPTSTDPGEPDPEDRNPEDRNPGDRTPEEDRTPEGTGSRGREPAGPTAPGLPGQRTSSRKRGGHPAVEETTTAVCGGGTTITIARSSLRPAQLNRPLTAGQASASLGWADPHLDRLLNEAMARARAQATQEGFTEGLRQGRERAAQEAAAQTLRRDQDRFEQGQQLALHVNHLLTALQEAVQQQSEELVPAWDELADALLDGALTIARSALGRELTSLDAQALQALRVAVRSLSGSNDLQVRLNPEDLRILSHATGDDSLEAVCPVGVHLAPDPQVPRGGVQAQATTKRVKILLSEALARAEEVLRS
ncbi:MAG: flagellar assembly protein FliH [Actinomycetota bacterium]|nr:flagellar assembly protein FliH [Actinomycetota bacterium]